MSTKFDKKTTIAIAILFLSGVVFVIANVLNNYLVFDAIYGFRIILGLALSLLVVSSAIAYYFGMYLKDFDRNKVFYRSFITILGAFFITVGVYGLIDKIFPDFFGFLSDSTKYILYFVTIAFAALTTGLDLSKASLKSLNSKTPEFVKYINFATPVVAIVFVGFFLSLFKFFAVAILLMFAIAFGFSKLTALLFKNA